MSPHTRTCPVFVFALVAFTLAISGCTETGSPEKDAAPRAEVADDAPAADAPAEEQPAARAEADAEKPEPPVDSDVKLATAESRIRPPRETDEPEAADQGAEEPADDERLEPPAKLPAATAPLPLDNVETADLTMPEVKLTEHHAATCRVGVGDAFPDLELSDLEGQQHKLSEFFGERLTLVVFWNGQEPTALEQLSDLVRYHHPRFADSGLAIVAINTGDPPQLATELAEQAGARFTVLTDADGKAFAQVATEKLPRSYVLDPAGQILWFDLEYAATTRRDMVQAIRYALAH